MKVLHISDTEFVGGSDAVFRDTIKVCDELGFTNVKFTSDKDRSVFSYFFSFKYYNKLSSLMSHYKPEVIHLHCYYHYLTPSILMAIKKYKIKNNVKVIFTAHDYHLICPNSGLQTFNKNIRYNINHKHPAYALTDKFDHRGWGHSFLKLGQRLLCYNFLKLESVFDLILSPSYFLKSTFEAYGINIPIEVVRNPVKLRENKIDFINNNNNEIKIAIAARIVPEKGVARFIEKLNVDSNVNISISLFGDGEELDDITKIKLKKHLKLKVFGNVEREILNIKMVESDIFVLPSIWYENAPISIIEAANAGLYIVVPDYGGLKEMAQLCDLYSLYNESDDLIEILSDAFEISKEKRNRLLNCYDFSYECYKVNIYNIYNNVTHDVNKVAQG